MYADVSVVVDGALEDEQTFYDETLMAEFIREIEDEARSDGYPTQVYVLFHDHPEGECECIQYVQSHKPYAEFNA
jgi:hypothetical protein